MSYQHTPRASKGNAFNWHSWEPQIDWSRGEAQARGGRNRAAQIDERRAAGKPDPLFIPGMGSSARQGPLDAARFAIAHVQKGSRRG